VGETKRSFKERYAEHKGDIKNGRLNKPLGKHFNAKDHISGHIRGVILEVINIDPALPKCTEIRKERERFWIYRLRTPETFGLNSYYANK
jgi:hypothetical protein